MSQREIVARCPDCGAAVAFVIRPGVPVDITPHGCPARACEYPGCRVRRLRDEMVQVHAGSWHCPAHGLLLYVKHLVALYRSAGDADWGRICEIIDQVLPEVVAKIESAATDCRSR